MTSRIPCPPAAGPLEGYAVRFDELFALLAQRRPSAAECRSAALESMWNRLSTCLAYVSHQLP